MLQYELVTYKKIDCFDLERFIRDHYEVDYEIVEDNEWNNDSSYNETVSKGEIDSYYKKRFEDWKEGFYSGSYMLRHILKDLCNKGEIEEGNYLIKVSW